MAYKKKLYCVDCYTEGGYCYATHHNCTWEDVKRLRKSAHALNETIKYEEFKY